MKSLAFYASSLCLFTLMKVTVQMVSRIMGKSLALLVHFLSLSSSFLTAHSFHFFFQKNPNSLLFLFNSDSSFLFYIMIFNYLIRNSTVLVLVPQPNIFVLLQLKKKDFIFFTRSLCFGLSRFQTGFDLII